MTRANAIQPHALIELTRPVDAMLLGAAPVPSTHRWPLVLPLGLRIRVAWDHLPGDGSISAIPEGDPDRHLIATAFPDGDGPGTEGYGIRIDADALDGAFTPIENRRWAPEDMGLAHAGHLRLIVRHLGMDDVWLDILPAQAQATARQGLADLHSGLITFNEFQNSVLEALDVQRREAR